MFFAEHITLHETAWHIGHQNSTNCAESDNESIGFGFNGSFEQKLSSSCISANVIYC